METLPTLSEAERRTHARPQPIPQRLRAMRVNEVCFFGAINADEQKRIHNAIKWQAWNIKGGKGGGGPAFKTNGGPFGELGELYGVRVTRKK